MAGIFQHELGHEVVFKVRIMWRCCRLDQEFFDKSMDIIESDWIPLVDHLDDGTHFWGGVGASIPVWIQSIGQSTQVESIPSWVFGKVKQEDKFV